MEKGCTDNPFTFPITDLHFQDGRNGRKHGSRSSSDLEVMSKSSEQTDQKRVLNSGCVSSPIVTIVIRKPELKEKWEGFLCHPVFRLRVFVGMCSGERQKH